MLFQKTPLKVLLADDHPLIVLGLKNAIRELLPNASFYEAIDGDAALELLRNNSDIELSIIDVNMPKLNGLQVLKKAYRILNHQTKSIILTLHKDAHYYESGQKLKVQGYLLKEHALSELATCLNQVLSGELYLSPAMKDLLKLTNTNLNPIERLNGQERELLKLLGDGKSQKEISELLVISFKSTSKSMNKICHKLELPLNENSLKAWIQVNQVSLS